MKRIRGRTLQTLRRRLFMKNPLCAECEKEGTVRPATERDHIIPLCKGGQDVESNTQGLCDDHHAVKTAHDMGHAIKPMRQTIGLDGWPIEDNMSETRQRYQR